MRFVDVNGILGKARRFVSKQASVSPEEVKDPNKLAEIIRQLSVRVLELESRLPVDGVEFERDITGDPIGGADTFTFEHNLGGPVRWYVVHWSSTDTAAPSLLYQASSTSNSLVLDSYSTGRVVLRIEPSQYGVT